ncbi:WW domain protein, partial [Ostertagia ostertagi]
MSSALAAMEAAALKAMRENGEGIEQGPALPFTGLSSKIFDPRQLKDVGSFAREMAKRKNEMVEMKNQKRAAPQPTSSMASKYFKKEIPHVVDYSEFTAPVPKEEMGSSAEIQWAEADAGDGRTYYFHLYTGEATWERPEFFFTKEQYNALIQSGLNSAIKMEVSTIKEEEPSTTVPHGYAITASETPIEQTVVPEVKLEPTEEEEAANVPHSIYDIPLPGP